METFILIAGLIAAAIGALVLLLSLVQKRAQLVRAFNLKMEIEERQRIIEANQEKQDVSLESDKSILTPAGAGAK